MIGIGTPTIYSRIERIVTSLVSKSNCQSDLAYPAAMSCEKAGGECTHQKGDKEPQRRADCHFARLVRSSFRGVVERRDLLQKVSVGRRYTSLRSIRRETRVLRHHPTQISSILWR
jgi:hypothetical protein